MTETLVLTYGWHRHASVAGSWKEILRFFALLRMTGYEKQVFHKEIWGKEAYCSDNSSRIS